MKPKQPRFSAEPTRAGVSIHDSETGASVLYCKRTSKWTLTVEAGNYDQALAQLRQFSQYIENISYAL